MGLTRGVRRLVAIVSLWLALPGAALCGQGQGQGQGDAVRLELGEPATGAVVESALPLAAVSGRAVRDPMHPVDLVIAIDLSESAHHPSGADLDGDGIVGTLRTGFRGGASPLRWTTDRDDTVVFGAVEAARRLLAAIDPERVRVGLLTFAGHAREHAPLGTPAEARRALDALHPRLDRTGTNLWAVTRAAMRLLDESPADASEPRDRVLLLLTDGQATTPAPRRTARRYAVRAAHEAADESVRIFGLEPVGAQVARGSVLPELAEITGGLELSLADPAQAARQLPSVEAVALREVSIENLTTEASARALRVFGDGSFDAYVPLVPGVNRIRVRARSAQGAALELVRNVVYRPRAEPTRADRALRDSLRARTLETELVNEKRDALRRRSLVIETAEP
jgi:hypothetical protein